LGGFYAALLWQRFHLGSLNFGVAFLFLLLLLLFFCSAGRVYFRAAPAGGGPASLNQDAGAGVGADDTVDAG